jgi:ubiquinone/menaquinone biosynthesis C-methylase UbiE
MGKGFIIKLHCPFCRNKLKISKKILARKDSVVHGVLSCKCSLYPVLDGVIYLAKDDTAQAVLAFLKHNSPWLRKNTKLPYFIFSHSFFGIQYFVIFFKKLKFFENINFVSFVKLFKALGFYEKGWANYLLGRSRDVNLRAAISCLPRFNRGSLILDLASGAGHFLNFVSKITSQKNICAVESSLVGIYLSQRYFAKKVNYIYLNLEAGLPFENNYFDGSFINDALHYIKSKAVLCKEVDRVTRKNGTVVLTNLHNKNVILPINKLKHFPEYLDTYIKLFPNRKAKAFTETNLIRNRLELITTSEIRSHSRKARKITLVFS